MNKKLILCGAIAVGLLLVACSKEKEPSPDNQPAQSEQTTNPASEQFHSINENTAPPAASEIQPPAPPAHKVEIQHEETEHTTTEIRREVKDPNTDTSTQPTDNSAATSSNSSTTADNSASTDNSQAVTEKKPAPSKKTHLTEDDAVAAAIAAAKPALNN